MGLLHLPRAARAPSQCSEGPHEHPVPYHSSVHAPTSTASLSFPSPPTPSPVTFAIADTTSAHLVTAFSPIAVAATTTTATCTSPAEGAASTDYVVRRCPGHPKANDRSATAITATRSILIFTAVTAAPRITRWR